MRSEIRSHQGQQLKPPPAQPLLPTLEQYQQTQIEQQNHQQNLRHQQNQPHQYQQDEYKEPQRARGTDGSYSRYNVGVGSRSGFINSHAVKEQGWVEWSISWVFELSSGNVGRVANFCFSHIGRMFE